MQNVINDAVAMAIGDPLFQASVAADKKNPLLRKGRNGRAAAPQRTIVEEDEEMQEPGENYAATGKNSTGNLVIDKDYKRRTGNILVEFEDVVDMTTPAYHKCEAMERTHMRYSTADSSDSPSSLPSAEGVESDYFLASPAAFGKGSNVVWTGTGTTGVETSSAGRGADKQEEAGQNGIGAAKRTERNEATPDSDSSRQPNPASRTSEESFDHTGERSKKNPAMKKLMEIFDLGDHVDHLLTKDDMAQLRADIFARVLGTLGLPEYLQHWGKEQQMTFHAVSGLELPSDVPQALWVPNLSPGNMATQVFRHLIQEKMRNI
ncbi:unnamed protein product [Amoebophrya sp. A120]|nr:unnamed protein product [Amoebophrya sp. A120]|eukprot:GSA120T00003594001.1